MEGGEPYSIKLYAFPIQPKVKYPSDSETKTITDISIAISRCPTLAATTGLEPNGIMDKVKVKKMGHGKRIIEFPSSDELQVSEFITSYYYESPIPEWLGWIIGMGLAYAIINLGDSTNIIDNVIPSWVIWLCVFFLIGFAWSRYFEDKKYYLDEIYISGKKDIVVRFARELKSNMGRDPIYALSLRDINRFMEASGLEVDSLEESWRRIEE